MELKLPIFAKIILEFIFFSKFDLIIWLHHSIWTVKFQRIKFLALIASDNQMILTISMEESIKKKIDEAISNVENE